jgi:hypothetical protein
LRINNDYYDNLCDNEVSILKKTLFNYIEDFAISKNKTKIIIDNPFFDLRLLLKEIKRN